MLNLATGRHLKSPPTGGRTEQASNTARGTPGNRHFRGNDRLWTTTSFVHRVMGCFGAPAFRASLGYFGGRSEVKDEGAPRADQTTETAAG